MDLQFSEQQISLAASVAGVLRRRYDFAARRTSLAGPVAAAADWPLLVDDLGLTGLMIHPELGGQGGSAIDAMVVMAALGRRLVLEPFAQCCIAAPALLCGTPSGARLLPDIAAGSRRVVPALPEAGFNDRQVPQVRRTDGEIRVDGELRFVVGGPLAHHFLIAAAGLGTAGERAILLLPAATLGLSRRDYRMVDGRVASDLSFDGVELSGDAVLWAPAETAPRLAYMRDASIVALCAEATGVMREMIDLTADFVSNRRQFGTPLATFQVIQHRLVDMALALEKADAMTLRATLLMDADDDTRSQAAAAAKIVTSEAVRLVGQAAVQLHGGTGTAEETPVSHYFRRATVIEGELGTGVQHLDRYAASFARAARGPDPEKWR